MYNKNKVLLIQNFKISLFSVSIYYVFLFIKFYTSSCKVVKLIPTCTYICFELFLATWNSLVVHGHTENVKVFAIYSFMGIVKTIA